MEDNSWSNGPRLPKPFQSHCMCAYSTMDLNQRYLIIGGEDGKVTATAYTFVYLYDFDGDSWTVLPNLPSPRANGACSPFVKSNGDTIIVYMGCLLYTSPSPRDRQKSRMPSSA